jgi:hypothetical protein
MPGDETPVSWTAVGHGAVVVAADGQEVGNVQQVNGDEQADIFDGLVVSPGLGRKSQYVAAERVTHMTADRVETSLSTAEAASLPAYDQALGVSRGAGEGARIGERLRGLLRRR